MLADDVHGACLMWWSPDDGDGVWLMMMQLWSWLDDALIDDDALGDDLALITWWPCLDHLMEMTCLDGDGCLMSFGHVEDDMIRWWRWHDDVLPWFVDGDNMMMSCHDWYVDDIPCWWWHDTFMCLMGRWWAYEPCDEVSYTLSLTYPCASLTYSCNPLQDPHTPILNPNTPSYTPSLHPTLPHNPSYNLELCFTLPKHHFILMLSFYLA